MPKKITDHKEHFWSRVDKSGGPDACWPWTGSINLGGYGLCGSTDGLEQLAHRRSYFYSFGPPPIGKCICHRCDNPQCCNPVHLVASTQRDNQRDMMHKGRHVKRLDKSSWSMDEWRSGSRKNLRYKAGTSILIGSTEQGCAGSPEWLRESLYRSEFGKWFLVGEGGWCSRYSVTVGNRTTGSQQLKPIGSDLAKWWIEHYGEPEMVE